ncbi:hypothetical protein NL108_016833 [Boleophthalmus pectinirostris]|uniref:tubulin-specific chaperone C n=1 Tax=Boleophthalmus pectinirostris TaxID=150288 RepID=UPI002431C4BC|nr:tubulin-specific chaperone C [Boleophthalmus pectinirostris]KAJ0060654.1 hypothetical protein NL108_016833 [Boleophthalmus pectinirostris]
MAAVEKHETEALSENNASTVQERLTKRHQTRQEDAERRREENESHKLAEEKADYFNSEFKRERAEVSELVRRVGPAANRAEAEQLLERAAAKTAQLQKFLNDSMLFLTQYDLRQSQEALRSLQSALNDARDEAMPKKKFTFRARSKATEKSEKTPTETPTQDTTTTDGGGTETDTEQCGFSNLSDANLTKTAEEIEKRDVLLTGLKNCKVKLLGSCATLHLKHIESCEILCGPVSGSVFVDQCRDSVLALACQQLRTHNTSSTRVYLHVTSRAIVEDCAGVGFAPFAWSYPGLERDFLVSGLDPSRNNWNLVDDFNWLVPGTQSPNWSVIPEDQRRDTWD